MGLPAELIMPRSQHLAEVSTTADVLRSRAVPGVAGVILDQQTVVFSDLWHLAIMHGVEVSLTRDLDRGRAVFRLRSGSRRAAPFTRPSAGLQRIIAHVHPSGQAQRLPSQVDIDELNKLYLYRLARNPYATPERSRVIFGAGVDDFTIFWSTVLR